MPGNNRNGEFAGAVRAFSGRVLVPTRTGRTSHIINTIYGDRAYDRLGWYVSSGFNTHFKEDDENPDEYDDILVGSNDFSSRHNRETEYYIKLISGIAFWVNGPGDL
jgi:hypothetical protein